MDKEKTGGIDYEAKIHRMSEENEMLRMKLSDVTAHLHALESENFRMKAQLDIVHLIFGK